MIRIHDLNYHYADGRLGLAHVDLTIPEGQLLVIAGANGSGKTTLLRHINGLLKPQSGDVLVDGISATQDLRRLRRRVGMVFQESDSQIIGETVFADVSFGPQNLAWPSEKIEKAVADALIQAGLDQLARHSPHLLSGGERKRLSIAGVLVMQPAVVIFDEPFANLDYPGVRSVLSQIVSLHRLGRTIIIAAHDIEKIVYHSQRLLIMEQGRIVADGIPDALFNQLERYGIRRPCAARAGQPVDSWLS